MNRRERFILAAVAAAMLALAGARVLAQGNTSATPVGLWTQYQMGNLTATAAASTQTTLTIPAAPPTFYNYVWSLHFNARHDNTATTALTNRGTASTKFHN